MTSANHGQPLSVEQLTKADDLLGGKLEEIVHRLRVAPERERHGPIIKRIKPALGDDELHAEIKRLRHDADPGLGGLFGGIGD